MRCGQLYLQSFSFSMCWLSVCVSVCLFSSVCSVCLLVCLSLCQGEARCGQNFLCNPLSLLSAGVWLQADGINNQAALPSHQLPAVQVEARSPDRNESVKEEKNNSTGMYLDNEVSITTPLTGGVEDQGGQRASNADVEGELSEVDITSQHNSVISQTPDSTISGPVPVVICETPGRAFSALLTKNLTKLLSKPSDRPASSWQLVKLWSRSLRGEKVQMLQSAASLGRQC